LDHIIKSVVNIWLLLSKKDMSTCLTDIVSEVIVFLFFHGMNGGINLLEDINSVNNKIFADVDDSTLWAAEISGHFSKFLPVFLNSLARNESILDLSKNITDILESCNDFSNILGFEVFHSTLNILDDIFTIIDAFVEIRELRINRTFDYSSNNFEDIFDSIFIFNWCLLSNKDLGSSFTNVVTEVVPISTIIGMDSTIDLSDNADTMDDDISSNMNSSRFWVAESDGHLFELSDLIVGTFACFHSISSFKESIAKRSESLVKLTLFV